jgi:diguanylate cyclase (GGDEF)-like protein
MSLRLRHNAGPLIAYSACFAAVWGLLGPASRARTGLVLVALGLQLLIGAGLAVRDHWDHRQWVGIAGVVMFLTSVALLRQAMGPQAGVYGLLLLLTVVWAALRSRRGELAVALVALACFVALVVARGERYPPVGWHSGVLLVVVATVLGVGVLLLVDRLRASERQTADHQRDLLAVARTARTLAQQTDPAQVPLTVCAAVRDLAGTLTAAIWQRQDDGSLIRFGADGGPEPASELVPGRDHHPALDCARDKRSVLSASAYFEPLIVDGATLGVLAASWGHGMTELPERSRVLLGLLADEAATAMQRAQLVEQLAHLARTDPLTGLINRRGWDELAPLELVRAARHGHPLTFALLDLDHFKAYNDHCGHQAGDQLLKGVCLAWNQALRRTDLLCRWGGEEFAVLMPDCGLEQARELVQRLRGLLPDGQTCSAGLARWDGKADLDDLISRADIALYDAKRAGRDQVVTA